MMFQKERIQTAPCFELHLKLRTELPLQGLNPHLLPNQNYKLISAVV